MLEADWKYLTPLELHDIKALVLARCGPGSVSQEEVADLYEEAGGHPWLTQRLLSRWIATKAESPRPSMCELALAFQEEHEVLFENWWGENGYSGGLTGLEREIYRAILLYPKLSVSDASNTTNQSENDCRQALKILLGLGAVTQPNGVSTELVREFSPNGFALSRRSTQRESARCQTSPFQVPYQALERTRS
jgi:hypothetical protein